MTTSTAKERLKSTMSGLWKRCN